MEIAYGVLFFIFGLTFPIILWKINKEKNGLYENAGNNNDNQPNADKYKSRD
jgi:hypothetical protein